MLTKEEFKKEYIRMMDGMRDPRSKNFGHFNCTDVSCHECPLDPIGCNDSQHAVDLIEAVEEWGKAHPFITNADKFKEVFGIEPRIASGAYICPGSIASAGSCWGKSCNKCQKEFWEAEYKEPKKGE